MISSLYSLRPLRCWQLSTPQKLGKIDEGWHQAESSNYRYSNIDKIYATNLKIIIVYEQDMTLMLTI
jgi:hypothetical protein